MRSRSPRHLTVVLLALALAAVCFAWGLLPAQLMSPPPDFARSQPANVLTTTIHVNGVVVSSLDGKPVARALVTSMDRHFAALTDWQGRFAFDYRMPAQNGAGMSGFAAMGMPYLGLLVQKPGYVNSNQTSVLPAVAPGATTNSVQLKITPASVISGHVTPDSGDLPNGLRASIRRRQAQDGITQWIQAGMVQVDRNGDFRFADLTPGDYIVMTSGWSQPRGFGPQNRPDTIRGLLPTYYPGAATLAEATPVHLHPGETADVTLRPSSATFYRVSVGVDGLSSPTFNASLLSDPAASFMINANQASHTVEGYLPSGSYTLRIDSLNPVVQPGTNFPGPAGIAAPGKRTRFFAHLEVGSSPLIGRTITAAPAADIQVEVTRNFTSTQQQPNIELAAGPPEHPNPPVYIEFRSVDDASSFSNSQQDVDGNTITVHNIGEGTYHVHINAPQGYVASALSGSTNLLTTPLTVGAGGSAAPIYVTLRDDYASLSCQLQTNEAPDATGRQTPTYIVAIPLDTPEARVMPVGFFPQQFRMPTSNLPPGRYLLLGGPPDRIQTLEYRNPEVLHELMSKGVIVTLAPGEKASVEVPLAPDGDN
jgi:hypothetical protein